MMNTYQYKPVRFYVIVFIFTWVFWITAAVAGQSGMDNSVTLTLMLLGLFVPSITALYTVFTSKSAALKTDLRLKFTGLFRIQPLNIILAILTFGMIVASSIFLSTLFGESLGQFALVEDFSFAGGGSVALLTIVLAAFLEELGWRGYAEDSIAFYCNWWKESIIFGAVWGIWHLPLFFIPDTYHYNILQESPVYMINFFVSIMPLGFIVTWVYVYNNRSLFATILFHFFVNLLQEKVAMTNKTKCVETIVLFFAAGIIVAANKDLFFETRHIGRLLPENEQTHSE